MPSILNQRAEQASLKMSFEDVQVAPIASHATDAFDGSAEPLIYMSENRTSALSLEPITLIIYVIFASLILSLLFILPGMRKTKISSFLSLSTILIMGLSIFSGLTSSTWLTGSTQLRNTPYSSLNNEMLAEGQLEILVGLTSGNVTLTGFLFTHDGKQDLSSSQLGKSINYNERFHWDEPGSLSKDHLEALRKGLPYPLLSVSEFLSQDSDGFQWARQLRVAGYYASLSLYAALVSWCLTIVMICIVPSYLPRMVQITAALMMFSVWIYSHTLGSTEEFYIQRVRMELGTSYMAMLVSSAYSLLIGVFLFAINLAHPNDPLTIMDSERYVEDRKALYGDEIKKKQAFSDVIICVANNQQNTADK